MAPGHSAAAERSPYLAATLDARPNGRSYPLGMTNSLLLNMAIEIVDLPIEHGDFP